MKWFEIFLKTKREDTDDISLKLISRGANGTIIKDPLEVKDFISSLKSREYADEKRILDDNKECTVIGYFSVDEDIDLLIDRIFELTKIKARFIIVDDSSWKDKWKEYFKPFNITETIRIIPSWSPEAKALKKNDIIMDPGMAFGTGTHETTKLCADLIEKYIKRDDDFIDVGTGTGILSVIASKHGINKGIAIDIDTASIKAARENMVNNNISNVEVIKGELKNISDDFKAHVIAANIIADVIIELSTEFKNHIVNGGKVICSGIINSRKGDVIDSLLSAGFSIVETVELNEWTAIVANA